MRPMTSDIVRFAKDCSNNGITGLWVTPYDAYKVLRGRVGHLRGGKCMVRGEAFKKPVAAYGWDELGNIVALCWDGATRQYLSA